MVLEVPDAYLEEYANSIFERYELKVGESPKMALNEFQTADLALRLS
jgi:hypothetical protein